MTPIPENLPVWLREELSIVLRDFAVPPAITLDVVAAADDVYEVHLVEDGARFGAFGVAANSAGPERLVQIADGLQDELAESRSAWGAAQPPCKARHRHPAQAREFAGRAVWVCPEDDEVIALIGATTS